MRVEVRPIEFNKWHGKKDKENFSKPKVVEVLYDSNTGGYATGLTDEEAQKYGKLMGVDLSNVFLPDTPHPYWSTKPASIILPNHTVFFDTVKPSDFVKVKNMKASKLVANSLKELEDGLWPEATHVIFDEAEEVAAKATKVNLRRDCYMALEKMTDEDKIGIIQILSKKSVRGRSPDFINVEIDDIITNQPAEFLKFFKMGREEVRVRSQVLEALFRNILTKEGSAIFYLGDQLAADYEGAVIWFKDPNNQKLKVAILEKLNR